MSARVRSKQLATIVCCGLLASACWSSVQAARSAIGKGRPDEGRFPAHRYVADKAVTEQDLAALDAEIEASTVMAHFVWTLDRFSRFMDGYTRMYPERGQLGRDLSARWRNDQEEALDVYMKLLVQITTGPGRDVVSERVAATRQDMDNRGQGHLKGYLPVLLRHLLELQSGATPSRDQMRSDILSVPNAAAGR